MDEFILAHSYYGTLVKKNQGLINGGWTGRTIYLQFLQGHCQQSKCPHGNPGDSGTPRRQARNPAWPFTRSSNTATGSMPDPVPIPSVPQHHPGCYHLGLDTRAPKHTHPASHLAAIADVSRRYTHSPLPLGRRTSEAARNGWHRLSPRNMPCHPAPVSGEAGKAVTVRALTGTTDETWTRPRAAVLNVSAHTRHGPLGHQATLAGVHVSTGWVSAPFGRRWYGVRLSSIDHLMFIIRPYSVVAIDNSPAFLDRPVDGHARGSTPAHWPYKSKSTVNPRHESASHLGTPKSS